MMKSEPNLPFPLAREVAYVWRSLELRERQTVSMRLGLAGSRTPMVEIARAAGVSAERARQIERSALDKFLRGVAGPGVPVPCDINERRAVARSLLTGSCSAVGWIVSVPGVTAVWNALDHPLRMAIVQSLLGATQRWQTVNSLSRAVDAPQSTVRGHLLVLRQQHAVDTRLTPHWETLIDGRHQYTLTQGFRGIVAVAMPDLRPA